MKLVIVSASSNPERAMHCLASWNSTPKIVVLNGYPKDRGDAPDLANTTWLWHPEFMGSVPAFRMGVDYALSSTDADIIANFHDDLELLDPDWPTKVIRHFERHPACGLAGFGGAIGLGDDDIYQKPYAPIQLARKGFRSNLVDAEVHGMRSLLTERVACLDGFSQIGRREFWGGEGYRGIPQPYQQYWPWHRLEESGFIHHGYDSALGAIAAQCKWETWYLPIRCRHYGGQTAVGDQGYQKWAESKIQGGDQGFWQQAHAALYELGRGILPLRV